MSTRPILFSTPMVQAILEGRKTQTRRIVKYAIGWDSNWHVDKIKEEHKDGIRLFEMRCGTQYATFVFKCPYGLVGDVLWLRETHLNYSDENSNDAVLYKADPHAEEFSIGLFENKPKWKPSIFMPKEACRLFLKITNIRVERLQGISEADAKAEGSQQGIFRDGPNTEKGEFQLELNNAGNTGWIAGFKYLWYTINGKGSWGRNPWVWVISFEKTERPKGFLTN